MALVSFSVSEVRVAATCPRITYFDAEHTRRNGLKNRSMTRLWKAGGDETACGTLFHNAVEAFNRQALDAPEVREALDLELTQVARRNAVASGLGTGLMSLVSGLTLWGVLLLGVAATGTGTRYVTRSVQIVPSSPGVNVC